MKHTKEQLEAAKAAREEKKKKKDNTNLLVDLLIQQGIISNSDLNGKYKNLKP